MKYVKDLTGRFGERPHFERGELDVVCDRAVLEHADRSRRELSYPLSTDFLSTLVEAHAASLDLYADLAPEGTDVEGVTDFFIGAAPRVRISRLLAADPTREVRLRTTLAHEFGHVHLHNALFQAKSESLDLFTGAAAATTPQRTRASGEDRVARCKRETITGAAATDWMEWQAGYVCGALLMPKRKLSEYVRARRRPSLQRLLVDSDEGRATVGEIAERFFVSTAAARVRLLVLDLATEKEVERSVFE